MGQRLDNGLLSVQGEYLRDITGASTHEYTATERRQLQRLHELSNQSMPDQYTDAREGIGQRVITSVPSPQELERLFQQPPAAPASEDMRRSAGLAAVPPIATADPPYRCEMRPPEPQIPDNDPRCWTVINHIPDKQQARALFKQMPEVKVIRCVGAGPNYGAEIWRRQVFKKKQQPATNPAPTSRQVEFTQELQRVIHLAGQLDTPNDLPERLVVLYAAQVDPNTWSCRSQSDALSEMGNEGIRPPLNFYQLFLSLTMARAEAEVSDAPIQRFMTSYLLVPLGLGSQTEDERTVWMPETAPTQEHSPVVVTGGDTCDF